VESPPALRLIEALGLKSGIVSSGNSLNCGPEDRAALEASGASIKEMEGASIAYVASLFAVPLLAIKAITDIVDGGRVSGTAALCVKLRGLCMTRRCSLACCACVRCDCVPPAP
jgi:nucleoside phosphorylase